MELVSCIWVDIHRSSINSGLSRKHGHRHPVKPETI